ncbi:MAG: DUF192 domain-containing protein [Bdellovibrionales bacterium]
MNARLFNQSKNLTVVPAIEDAKSVFTRLKGLLGRDSLATDSTLWIEPCNSIHTCFMRFPIDAVFVDRNLVVRKVVRGLKPWRLVPPVFGAVSVFEFAAGVATPDKVAEGDQLHVGH